MAKTGWKAAAAGGNGKSSGKTNRLPKTSASSKMGKGRAKEKDQKNSSSNVRSAETIARLKMYANGKAIRNQQGKVVAGCFQLKNRAGDREIDASTGRIQPDRRWFGNTRIVDGKQLDRFRTEMTQHMADPYSVVLKRKKVPLGLLHDVAEMTAVGNAAKNQGLLEQEPFERTFGKQSIRKRVKLDQLLVSRAAAAAAAGAADTPAAAAAAVTAAKVAGVVAVSEGQAEPVTTSFRTDVDGYQALVQTAHCSQTVYEQLNAAEGLVPWGRDRQHERDEGEGIDWRHAKKDDLFLKGQSKRIWGEFFKVVDCSDVILHVIDARNVPGTRCTMIEKHIAKHAKHKHLVFVLNKIDLVPNWVAKRWIGELSQARPTIAFHASLTHAFGKGALISLLRQFGKLHDDKKEISVGVIGYPNVGKSSVINTLISKKSCKVAPIPGETKIWQYVSLFKRISLIDCPGVVVDTAGDSETDSVLKGVVRAERLEHPEEFVEAILEKVQREHICAQYKIPKDGPTSWNNSTELLELVAKQYGRLRKGGDPCVRSAAIMLINDFQRGRLPHFVPPPELKQVPGAPTGAAAAAAAPSDESTGRKGKKSAAATTKYEVKVLPQDLDAIGVENMHPSAADEEDDEDDDVSAAEEVEANSAVAAAKDDTMESDLATQEEEIESDTNKNNNASRPPASASLIGDGEWDDDDE